MRVPVHRVPQRQRVRLWRRAGGKRAQQRFGEGEQSGDGGEGVAGQPDEVLVVLEAGQQHGVSGTGLDAVHEEFGADAAQGRVDVVDRAGGGAAGRDDQVGLGGRDGAVQGLGVVADPADGADVGTEGAQPGRQHRAERVADEAVVREPLGEQLVSEDEDVDAGAGDRGERVVSGGRRQPQDRRGREGADGQQLVAAAALLAAGADVLAVDDLAGGVQASAFVGAAVLGAQDGGGVRGIRAPVAIRTASPSMRGAGAAWPARTPSSRTAQGPGPATAQPSIAEVSKEGRSVRAARGAASVRPRAASRGTATGVRRAARAAVRAARSAVARASGQGVVWWWASAGWCGAGAPWPPWLSRRP